MSTSLARTGAIFYISGFVALSHPRASRRKKMETPARRWRGSDVTSRLGSPTLYTGLSAPIRGESARPRDHCYPDVPAREEKREGWRTCRLHPYVGEKEEGGGGKRTWGRLYVPRAIGETHRNSATRLSDPRDLTRTEDATAEMTSCETPSAAKKERSQDCACHRRERMR